MPRKIKCTRCNATFQHQELYIKHITKCEVVFQEKAKKRAVISCEKCTKKYIHKKSYLIHKKNEHSELKSSVPCKLCLARCPNKKVLNEHIKNVHFKNTFFCPNCNLSFARKGHVSRHLKQSKCSGNIKKFQCDICNAKFSRKDNLLSHLRYQHINMSKCYTCKMCPNSLSFKSLSRLISHTQKVHWKNVQIECDICGKSTGSKNAMVKHMEIHGEKKYGCEVCGYTTFTPEVMRRHVLTHVPDKPNKCDHCPKSFIQLQQLRKHMLLHELTFQCSSCDEKFISEAALIAHSYEHEGKDKMKCHFEGCPERGFKFKNEKTLLKHIKAHISNEVYRCGVCGKLSTSALNARRHTTTHTLERARRCMYCVSARAYVRGDALVRHVRKAHPDVFRAHLQHVRSVLKPGAPLLRETRIRRCELEAILSVMDAEAEKVLEAGCRPGTLYAGMAHDDDEVAPMESSGEVDNWMVEEEESIKELKPLLSVDELKPLLSVDELADNLHQLLTHLVGSETLSSLGWPQDSVDVVLERVIEQCGVQPAERSRYSRVQRLRENAKHLFLNVVEDRTVANMLHTHTIDQIVKYILHQVTTDDDGY